MAIQLFQEALDATPADHPNRTHRLQDLGVEYQDRYQREGAIADLDNAIQLFQEALDAIPVDHPSRAGQLHNLGLGYHDRYQRTGAIADLDNAIQLLQEAMDATSTDYPNRARRLQDFGLGYHDRYQRTEAIADLDNAIRLFQEALDAIPVDYPDRAGRLRDLGAGLRDRYQRRGTIADLDNAIQLLQEALDATPADYTNRARLLQHLGTGIEDLFTRILATADLDNAIRLFQEALDATPADHPDRASRLRDLGEGYNNRHRETGATADFDNAMRLFQEALDITPADDPNRAGRLEILGAGHHDRYRETGATANLDNAIQLFQEALDITPINHPDRARWLQDLGVGYRNRYLEKGIVADLDNAIQLYRESLDHTPSSIRIRIESGKRLFSLLCTKENYWSQAFQAAHATISLVPLLLPRSLTNSDKQHILISIVGLASDAAAAALNSGGTPYDAIQVLEIGRGVITGSLNELRTDISNLHQRYPRMAEEFIRFRDQLDAPAASMQSEADQRYNAGKRLEQLIDEVRALPGFARFLLAPTEEEIRTAAESGPIVIVNISGYRCDALIIERSQIRALPLRHLHKNDILDRAKKSLADLKELEWLWDTIAQPVLNALRLTQKPLDGCWPRIWWVPTGPLARMPIHAAGYHSLGSFTTVLDRVISSYSTSIKALIHSRQIYDKAATTKESEKVVLVGMKKTPGNKDLQFAVEEVDELESLCRSIKLHISKPELFKKDVLSALKGCDIFHFAGHGRTNQLDPSESCLLLKDWKKEPLTVASLFETNISGQAPFLAYLSACGTGQVKHVELIDEGLHLISACQLAGFRHVIGTLWEVNDELSVDMARMTYEGMRDGRMADESVSRGLHNATMELRNQWLSVSAAARNGRKSFKEINTSLTEDKAATRSKSERDDDSRLPRDADISSDEEEETGSLLWVPYVHFGV